MVNLNLITDIVVDGIDHADYPDFCDAFISGGSVGPRDLTDKELDWINDTQPDFVYEQVLKVIY